MATDPRPLPDPRRYFEAAGDRREAIIDFAVLQVANRTRRSFNPALSAPRRPAMRASTPSERPARNAAKVPLTTTRKKYVHGHSFGAL